MTGADFHRGAPLPVPYTAATLAIGRDRLMRIQQACCCPVGLENLAFAYTPEEVKKHGAFLEDLLQPVNGFITLDLHNLYCQLHNFTIEFDTLIRLYPLERVREIHISGGSWAPAMTAPGQQVRRDTHDDRVPEAVFQLLEKAIPLCPQLKYVVLEQLGIGLQTPESQAGFRADFLRMQALLTVARRPSFVEPHTFLPPKLCRPPSLPAEDEALYRQQAELSAILEQAADCQEAQTLLAHSSLAGTAWNIAQWQPYMLETARAIAQKWKAGWA